MRLLLALDDTTAIENIKNNLGQAHELECFSPSTLFEMTHNEYDAIICSNRFYSAIRHYFKCPTFVLSPAEPTADWQNLLENGADGVLFDHLPVSALMGQVIASLRRLEKKGTFSHPSLGLRIDTEDCRITIDKEVLDLTLTEYKLLRELARTTDTDVVQRDFIQKKFFADSLRARTLDVHICSLRKKLKPFRIDIEAVRGVGYRLCKRDLKYDCKSEERAP